VLNESKSECFRSKLHQKVFFIMIMDIYLIYDKRLSIQHFYREFSSNEGQ